VSSDVIELAFYDSLNHCKRRGISEQEWKTVAEVVVKISAKKRKANPFAF
jgi:hypothetical protein